MRLSDAILMGRYLVTPMAGPLHSDEAKGFGCALTMGAKACGGKTLTDAFTIWPWLNSEDQHALAIAMLFDCEVMNQKITLEQLVDYVRSIEPAEEPGSDFIDPLDEEPWSDTMTAQQLYQSRGTRNDR